MSECESSEVENVKTQEIKMDSSKKVDSHPKHDRDESKDEEITKSNVTDILTHIGSIGVYQIALFLMLGAMEFFGADSIAMNFMGGFMDHWCLVSPIQNYSYPQQQYIAIPYDPDTDNGYGECTQFDLNYDSYSDDELQQWNRTVMTDGVNDIECDQWVYDRSLYASTIRNRWDLVCDRAWLVEMVSTIYMAGRLIGALSCGFVSDGIGRVPGIVIYNGFRFFGALLSLYSQGYAMFVMGRFFMAVGSTGSTLCAFVLITELIGSKYRAALGTLWQCIFSLGYMCLPIFAYFIRDETNLQALCTWPLLAYFLYAITVHESPRWLLSQDKEKEADEIVHFIGEVNKADLPDKLNLAGIHHSLREKKEEEEPEQTKGTFLDLFRYPNLRKKTFIIYFNWFTNSLVYYGLSLNSGRMAGSVYVNTFLMGAIEIPANFLAIYLMNKIGRKWQIGFSCIFGGVASLVCVVLILADASSGWLTAFSVLGKAGITMAFSGIYVYSVEIFPTGIRNAGIGSASMCARISGMAAPFVGGPLADIWAPMPSLIFALFALASGALMFLGPETLNKKLPETIEEAEAFGKKHSPSHDADPEDNIVSMKVIGDDANSSTTKGIGSLKDGVGQSNGHISRPQNNHNEGFVENELTKL